MARSISCLGVHVSRLLSVTIFLAACTSPGDTQRSLTLPEKVIVQRDVSFGPEPRERLDIYRPADTPAAGTPILVFFYGGGWRNGDKKEYSFLGETLAARGILTVIADYRLYPQATFPQFLDDGADAVAWIARHARAYGGDPRRIFLMGHSTGGYMAAMLGLDGQYLQRDGLSPANLAGVIGLAGIYDFSPKALKEYAPIFNKANLSAATQPLEQVKKGSPPMLLLTGTDDEAVGAQSTATLAAHIRTAGGQATVLTYPNVGPIGIMLPFSPLSHGDHAIVDDVTAFIFDKKETPHE